jgi:hypothetical protein
MTALQEDLRDEDDLRITPQYEKGVQEGTGMDLTKEEVMAAARH